MELRVEQLAARAEVSVDTVRFYQARGLLPPPRRQGRVALYGAEHLARLERIRALQAKGFTLATIGRLVRGELDAADESLVAALEAEGDAPESLFTIEELADRSGIPLGLLQALADDGLLIPRRHAGTDGYTDDDVAVARSGMALLSHGLPLPEVLDLARQHHAAMRAVAERAVALFDEHVRQPIRHAGLADDDAAAQLVDAFRSLLPATTDVVSHHFRRTLLAVAQEHIESVGADAERAAVDAQTAQMR
ncbi:MAG: putative MerR-family transcriptional regulator [Acidimicrobiales bacterium]|jgi:DNA-binding transcriptional MerR regulator|nr:putative MerR-family transcriptional regulator [Acidimicrobiales bacterium]